MGCHLGEGRLMEGIGPLIESLLGKLGVGRLDAISRLGEEWEAIAPEPWRSHSRPVVIRGETLVVEAPAAARSVLKYAERRLLGALDEALGPGVVQRVELRTTGRSG